MRFRSAVAVLTLVVVAGCAKSSPATKATTTTTAAGPTPTTTPANFVSTNALATKLDKSIVTPAQIQAALHLQTPPTAVPAPTVPQGPLNLDGVTAVFPSPIYKQALQSGGFTDGANRSFTDGTTGPNVLAMKFQDATSGGKFVDFATRVATTVGGAKATAHPELTVGVLPGTILRVPPSPTASPPNEIVVAAALYPNGVYYLVSISAAVASVTDEQVIALLRAQDIAYQANKAALAVS